ncbi:hypothetical protein AJ87_12845 [Rhizobium yanglingense]|nr:hypothetical protein AJ87_12845 [Rhizobium yanglingense]
MIGFDMTSILDDPTVRTAALLYMFHRLNEIYDGKAPIINLMDEAWKLLDDDEFKRTMKDYFKTIRKRNGLVIFGTQSADDVVRSSVSRTIIEQTSTTSSSPIRRLTKAPTWSTSAYPGRSSNGSRTAIRARASC